VAFGSAGFVAWGDGGGGSASTDRVGEGNGKFEGFLVFEFALSLALRFTPPVSPGLSLTSGETEGFVLVLAD
jgi:hypothetical protein